MKAKRLISLILCLSMVFACVQPAMANEFGGDCGYGLTWAFNKETGTLTISGDGELDYFNHKQSPWYSLRESIKSVVFDGEITELGRYAFLDCTALKEITIPESVTNLGNLTFEYCTNLTSVNILSQNLWFFDGAMFNGCDSLESITISENCRAYKSVDGLVCTKDGSTLVCYPAGRKDSSFTVPANVYAISEYAFTNHHFLQEIIIHKNVSEIAEGFVMSCPKISSILVDVDSEYYTAVDNVLFTKDMKTLLCYAEAKPDTSYTVPNGVERIGSYAFYDTNVKEFSIPDSLCTIGGYAFSYGAWYKENFKDSNQELYIGKHLLHIPQNATSYTVKEGTKSVASYAGAWKNSMTEVTLPDSIEYISNMAFNGSKKLEQVNFGQNLISIGEQAFASTGLKSITLPDSVEHIGSEAFEYTPLMENSDLWDGDVLYIGRFLIKANKKLSGNYSVKEGTRVIMPRAFNNCSNVESVTLPDSVEIIGDEVFSWKSKLKNIPENIVSIGDWAYRYANLSGESLVLPEGLEYVGEYAFEREYIYGENAELIELTLPSTLKEVGDYAFSRSNLKSLTIKNPDTKYGKGVFGNNSSLESVVFPDGMARIEDDLFEWAYLKYVYIPKSIEYMGRMNFSYDSEAAIFYPGTEAEWDEIEVVEGNYFDRAKVYYNFISEGRCGEGTEWELDVSTGTLTISGIGSTNDYAIRVWGGPDYDTPWESISDLIENVVIKYGVTGIGESAFRGLTNLKKIYIPSSVKRIGGDCFTGCYDIEEVHVDDLVAWNSTTFDSISYTHDHQSYSHIYNSNPLTVSSGAILYEDYNIDYVAVVPDWVTSIPGYALSGCSALTKVIVHDDVTSIGYGAFSGCVNLKEIQIPDSVTSIGGYAFEECSSLAEIMLPGNITSIGKGAFSGAGLREITIPGNRNTTIAANTFLNCGSLKSVVINDGVESIGDGAFTYCKALESIYIPVSVTHIANDAFFGVYPLTVVCKLGSYAEEFALSMGFEVVNEDAFNSLTLKAVNTQGSEIEGEYTVNWYEKDSDEVVATGKTIFGYDSEKEYQYEIVLGEKLSYEYYQPQRQDVVIGQDEKEISFVLEEVENISV